MEEVHIRPAKAEDLDRIWELWKIIMDQKIYFPYDDSYSRADIEKEWINLDNACFVAELNQQIVGAYILLPNQPGHGKHIANAAYMVDTSIRGHGVGTKLCAHSVIAGKELGYRGIQFNLVVSTNEAAIKAWQSNGFKIIGTVPGGFHHFELGYVDAHIFFKNLV